MCLEVIYDCTVRNQIVQKIVCFHPLFFLLLWTRGRHHVHKILVLVDALGQFVDPVGQILQVSPEFKSGIASKQKPSPAQWQTKSRQMRALCEINPFPKSGRKSS